MTPVQTAALLSALSTEFADMSQAAEGLSGVVMDHARLVPPADRSRVLTQAQAIDALVQRLVALGDLAGSLSEDRPVDLVLNAVPLADLGDRLRQAVLSTCTQAQAPSLQSGDLHLFD